MQLRGVKQAFLGFDTMQRALSISRVCSASSGFNECLAVAVLLDVQRHLQECLLLRRLELRVGVQSLLRVSRALHCFALRPGLQASEHGTDFATIHGGLGALIS